MPKVQKNGKVKAPQKKESVGREVIYPVLSVNGAEVPTEQLTITCQQMKTLLGWETEKDYKARTGKDLKEYLLIDVEGNKVVCHHNDHNRPFSESWARTLAQDILNRNWAGPTTMPGETVNGETIVVGRTGRVSSGQHRGVGLILACQLWAGKNHDHWVTLWPEEPILESLVVTGVSESPHVIRTLDNVKPRSLLDVFYTSEIFVNLKTLAQKKECSRMLDNATKLLWQRTGAGSGKDKAFTGYLTHSEALGFVERHPKLLKCIKHIFEENQDRQISKQKLSPGQCAAMMYLMGSSSTDGDVYRNADPPNEKKLSWDNWDKAEEFWTLAGTSTEFKAVRSAINPVSKDNEPIKLSQSERISILCLAWENFLKGHKIKASDLQLSYHTKDDGERVLDQCYSFGGIDLGNKPGEPDEKPPSEEELEAEKERVRREKAEELAAKLKAGRRGSSSTEAKSTPRGPSSKDGKPPAPKLKPVNRKEVEAEQTRLAAEADAMVEDEEEEESDEDE